MAPPLHDQVDENFHGRSTLSHLAVPLRLSEPLRGPHFCFGVHPCCRLRPGGNCLAQDGRASSLQALGAGRAASYLCCAVCFRLRGYWYFYRGGCGRTHGVPESGSCVHLEMTAPRSSTTAMPLRSTIISKMKQLADAVAVGRMWERQHSRTSANHRSIRMTSAASMKTKTSGTGDWVVGMPREVREF